MTDLCRCGHPIYNHEIATGWHNSRKFRRESCRIDETGLFDKCKCAKVRPIDNLGYLEQRYEKAIQDHDESMITRFRKEYL